MPVKDYLRERFFPHMWCPGCGHFSVLNAITKAMAGLGAASGPGLPRAYRSRVSDPCPRARRRLSCIDHLASGETDRDPP